MMMRLSSVALTSLLVTACGTSMSGHICGQPFEIADYKSRAEFTLSADCPDADGTGGSIKITTSESSPSTQAAEILGRVGELMGTLAERTATGASPLAAPASSIDGRVIPVAVPELKP